MKIATSEKLTDMDIRIARATPSGLAYIASGKKYKLPPYLALLDEKLYELAYGRIKRLIVTMPPRAGKSLLCSQYFPAWYIAAIKERIILASYEAQFAASWGRKARDVLEAYGEQIFNVHVSSASSAADWWELDKQSCKRGTEAGMMTAGVNGAITGKGGKLLILDDPIKNAEVARSKLQKDHIWEWWQSTFYTRQEPGTSILLIMTRWAPDDIVGRLLEEEEKHGGEHWEHLNMPAIAESDERYELSDGTVLERKEGDPLWPERFSKEDMEAIKKDVGTKYWAALYQQHPSPGEGTVWKEQWFSQRYRELPEVALIVQVVDSAFKTGVANDYSVIATWAASKTGYYLIDVWRSKVEYTELKHAISDQYEKHHPRFVLIEDAAAGISAIQELKRETKIPILPVKADKSKIARAEAATPIAEAMRLWLPSHASWLADWILEHKQFPDVAHDDQVDTTSIGLNFLKERLAKITSLEDYLAKREGREIDTMGLRER